MRKMLSMLAMAIGMLGLVAGPVVAAHGEGWAAHGDASYDDGVVTITDNEGDGSSWENPNLGTEIEEGDVVSYEYRGTCNGGAPRVFFEVDGTYYNTWDGNEDRCGTDSDGDGWYRVTYTYTGEDGEIGHAGLVNDFNGGTVMIRNVRIGGERVLLASADDMPSSKEECKNGGWRDGPYRNQGECVSHFARNK